MIPAVHPDTWLNKLIGSDSAAPQQDAYVGQPVERVVFSNRGRGRFDHTDKTAKNTNTDFIKYFDMVRWNSTGFNK